MNGGEWLNLKEKLFHWPGGGASNRSIGPNFYPGNRTRWPKFTKVNVGPSCPVENENGPSCPATISSICSNSSVSFLKNVLSNGVL